MLLLLNLLGSMVFFYAHKWNFHFCIIHCNFVYFWTSCKWNNFAMSSFVCYGCVQYCKMHLYLILLNVAIVCFFLLLCSFHCINIPIFIYSILMCIWFFFQFGAILDSGSVKCLVKDFRWTYYTFVLSVFLGVNVQLFEVLPNFFTKWL